MVSMSPCAGFPGTSWVKNKYPLSDMLIFVHIILANT
jgi:hypothetical protein